MYPRPYISLKPIILYTNCLSPTEKNPFMVTKLLNFKKNKAIIATSWLLKIGRNAKINYYNKFTIWLLLLI